MFAGNFAPRGWAFCDGQLLGVSQNDALFSLLGTIYGGDGRTTFGLPDLRGRIPIHAGSSQGPGLSPRRLGAKAGAEKTTLAIDHLAGHTHDWNANTEPATGSAPAGKVTAAAAVPKIYNASDQTVDLASVTIQDTGESRSHTNLMPTLCVNFIIALFGIYPARH